MSAVDAAATALVIHHGMEIPMSTSPDADARGRFAQVPATFDDIAKEIGSLGARLQIIDRIEHGYGVVPVLHDGGVLLQQGEVAVYREEPPTDVVPGLYCLERQRPVAWSPRPDARRIVEREVVYVRRCRRPGIVDAPDAWEYITLESKIIRGVRRYTGPQGPIYSWALPDLLLGPVIGIYAPTMNVGEN